MARITYLAVRNWRRYQHYHDGRRLTFIKLDISLLDDPEIRALPIDVRLLFDQLLLVAGRTDNVIPRDIEWLSAVTALSHDSINRGTKMLLKGAWLLGFPSRKALEQTRQTEVSTSYLLRDRDSDGLEQPVNQQTQTLGNHLVEKLLTEIQDANEYTARRVHTFENNLPDAAFATALESLRARRARTDRKPLTSEARYVVAALNTMQREGKYGT